MRSKTRQRRARGYSLLEILVVVAIMSLLASVAVPAVMRLYDRSRSDTALLAAQSFRTATSSWRLSTRTDDCPTPTRLIEDKMLDRGASTKDPWGNEFAIACDDGGVTVSSAGPDRRLGTTDDIIAPPETKTASK
jgi:general secretion pathway protein G